MRALRFLFRNAPVVFSQPDFELTPLLLLLVSGVGVTGSFDTSLSAGDLSNETISAKSQAMALQGC